MLRPPHHVECRLVGEVCPQQSEVLLGVGGIGSGVTQRVHEDRPEIHDGGQPVAEHSHPVIDAVHADTPRRRASVVYVPGSRNLYNSETEIHYYGEG